LQESAQRHHENRLPARLAMGRVLGMLAPHTYAPGPITEDDKRAFSARMIMALRRQPPNWLAERYLSVALSVAHIDVVPHLVQWVSTLPPSPESDRLQALVAAVVIKLTGFDPTLTVPQGPGYLRDVMEEFRRECALVDKRNN
jgi:hypothetical protein